MESRNSQGKTKKEHHTYASGFIRLYIPERIEVFNLSKFLPFGFAVKYSLNSRNLQTLTLVGTSTDVPTFKPTDFSTTLIFANIMVHYCIYFISGLVVAV